MAGKIQRAVTLIVSTLELSVSFCRRSRHKSGIPFIVFIPVGVRPGWGTFIQEDTGVWRVSRGPTMGEYNAYLLIIHSKQSPITSSTLSVAFFRTWEGRSFISTECIKLLSHVVITVSDWGGQSLLTVLESDVRMSLRLERRLRNSPSASQGPAPPTEPAEVSSIFCDTSPEQIPLRSALPQNLSTCAIVLETIT